VKIRKIVSLIEQKRTARKRLFLIIESAEELDFSEIAPRIKVLNDEIMKLGKDRIELKSFLND
jgi:hypothetical protein